MIGLLTAALIVLAAHNLGAAVWSRAPTLPLGGWERRLALRLGLGLGLLAYLVLAAGLLGLARPWLGWALVLGGLLAGLPLLRAKRPAEPTIPVTESLAHPSVVDGASPWPRALDWALGAALAVVALFALAIALAPPAGYDELTYHLAAPKIYARTGWVSVLPYDHHSAFAFTLEMLYTLGLLVGNAATAKLLHVALAGLSLLALGVLARDWFGPRVARLAVLIVAFTPVVITHVPLAYTEFGLMAWSLLALLCFGEYLNLTGSALTTDGTALALAPRQPRWLAAAAVFAGLCGGVKVTAGLLTVLLAGTVLALAWRDRLPLCRAARQALALVAISGLLVAPWLGRAWSATGNPVFPFADGVFHSAKWSADRAAAYDAAQKEFGRALDEQTLAPSEAAGRQRGLARLLLAPWNATFHPTWFFDVGLNFDGKARLGPAYLALGLPFLLLWVVLLRRRPGVGVSETREETSEERYSPEFGRDVLVTRPVSIQRAVTVDTARALGLLLAYGLLNGLFWFVSMQYLRYLVPVLAVFALLAAWAADQLLRMRLAAVATALVLGMQVAGGLAFAVASGFPALRVALGSLDAERYAAGAVHAYDAMVWINQHPPQGKVALFGEPRGYWLDVDYLWGERNHHTLIPDSARASSEAYLDCLSRQLQVKLILVNGEQLPLDRVEGNDDVALLTQGVRAGRLVPVWEDPRRPIVVYELR